MQRRTTFRGLLAAAAAGMASMKTASVFAATSAPSRHTVEINQFAFEPGALPVRIGDRVTWINRDIVPHTATADDGSWDTGALAKDESAEIVISQAMLESYYCRFHPSMKAKLS